MAQSSAFKNGFDDKAENPLWEEKFRKPDHASLFSL